MKIKFIRSGNPIGYSYNQGDEADLLDTVAKTIIEDGFAVLSVDERDEESEIDKQAETGNKSKKKASKNIGK